MKMGVVGLPNVGKSTLFNAITNAGAASANYPFCTIEPNSATVAVPDTRLDVLAQLSNSKRIVPAVIEFVDIAGLVRGASKGEGLGNKFLSHIREVDAIVHVVRCFGDSNITHVAGKVSPQDDIEIINIELCLSDIETLNRRIEKSEKQSRSGDKQAKAENELAKKLLPHLEQGVFASNVSLTNEESELLKGFFLLTAKPVIYVANVSETEIGMPNPLVNKVKEIAHEQNCKVLEVSAKIEEELAQMPEEDRQMFLEDLDLSGSGLQRLIVAAYDTLGLISYLTTGEKETRAWTVQKGTKAPQAAGKIHSDFERAFIRAEVISYDELCEYKTMAAAREKGKVRSEGKEYVIKDGDVVLFRVGV